MFIFSEDPPLKYKGFGLSVLLYNLFNDSDINIEKWFTFLPGNNIDKKDVYENVGLKIKLLELSSPLKSIRKYNKGNQLYNQIVFFLFFPSILIALRRKPTQALFIPIGASALILPKIWLISLFIKNPIWLYVVDDLNEISSKQNRTVDKILCNVFFKRSFSNAHQIFAISDKLADVLAIYSRKKIEVILPCFQKVDRIQKNQEDRISKKYTFVFTGGLSFLYNDTLKIFAKYLEQLQQESENQFSIIIQTYSNKEEFDKVDFPLDMVEYRTSNNRLELYKTYEEANAFIVPYSFDHSYSNIISTSFPQKIAQIIQLGIPILVFSPPYGSVVDFFRKNKLDYIIDQQDYQSFKIKILKLCKAPKKNDALIQSYAVSYESHFSQKACLKKLSNS